MFHGADPTGAQAVAQQLLQTSSAMQGLADQVLAAEAKAELSTHAVTMIDDASLVLRSTASAIETAAHQIGNFDLPLSIAWRAIEPLRDRVAVEDLGKVEADVFDQLTRAIEQRQTPAEAGLHEDYFPPGYLDWLAADRAVVEAATRLDEYRRIAGDQLALFDGTTEYALAKDLHNAVAVRADLAFQQAIDASGAAGSRVQATDIAIAAALAGSFSFGSQLLGGALADRKPSLDEADFLTLLIADTDLATAFFNELGAQGTVDLAHRWAAGDVDQWREARPILAQALASVTQADRLAFTGSDLVAADYRLVPDQRAQATNSFHVEQLLVDAEFSTGFIVGAAMQSFERFGRVDYPGAAAVVSAGVIDRRVTAMAAVLKHDVAPEFFSQLSEAELEAVIIAGPESRSGDLAVPPYGLEHPDLGGEDLVPTLFFASAMADRATTARVVDVLAGVDGVVADERVADGLGLVLADTALSHFGSEREFVYLDAYDTVVRSGSGLSVLLAAMGPVTEQFVRNELLDGELDHDGTEATEFGSFVNEIRSRYHLGRLANAEDILDDRAEVDRLYAIASVATAGLSAVGHVGALVFGTALFAPIGTIALAASAVLLVIGFVLADRDDPVRRVLARIVGRMGEFGMIIEASAARGAVPNFVQAIPVVPQIQGNDLDEWARLFSVTVDRQFSSTAEQIADEYGD